MPRSPISALLTAALAPAIAAPQARIQTGPTLAANGAATLRVELNQRLRRLNTLEESDA